jgi:hypothetical protein
MSLTMSTDASSKQSYGRVTMEQPTGRRQGRGADGRIVLAGVVLLARVLSAGTFAFPADEIVLGKMIGIKDPASDKRIVSALGKEKPTDIGTPGVGGLDAGDDPLANGATLTLFANGVLPSSQTFGLPAIGWKRTGVGFVYRDSRGINGPVKVALVKRTPKDRFLLKVLVNGLDSGGDPAAQVNIVPPAGGTDAGLILVVNGGNRYGIRWGGSAGGDVKKDDGRVFLVAATAAAPAIEAGFPVAPPPTLPTTTTTTTIGEVSTTSVSTSSTTTTTAGDPFCGDGALDAGETCDDGNGSDDDTCPSDCVVDVCSPVTGTMRPFDVVFTPQAGVNVGGITVLVDYPEGRVEIPGPPIPGGTITSLPPGSFPIPTDLDHALRMIVAIGGGGGLAPGVLFRVNYRDCSGAEPPLPVAFGCSVLEATDPFSNPVTNEVTCAIVAP